MADLKMRPRFTVDVPSDVETVVQALRERVGDSDPPLEGYFNTAHCVLGIPAARRYLYSPELELTFESAGSDAGAGGVRVRALVGPRPAVWTAFVYLYAVLALIVQVLLNVLCVHHAQNRINLEFCAHLGLRVEGEGDGSRIGHACCLDHDRVILLPAISQARKGAHKISADRTAHTTVVHGDDILFCRKFGI